MLTPRKYFADLPGKKKTKSAFYLYIFNLMLPRAQLFVLLLLPLQRDLIIHPHTDFPYCNIIHLADGIDPKLDLRLINVEILDISSASIFACVLTSFSASLKVFFSFPRATSPGLRAARTTPSLSSSGASTRMVVFSSNSCSI